MDKLPIVISVPHSGNLIPDMLRDNYRLSVEDVLYDSDTWTDRLYDFEKRVLHTALMPVARSVLDLNRMEIDRPPENEDGVIKTASLLSSAIWHRPLSTMEIESLLEGYYRPYYKSLEEASKKAVLGIDCHSMLPYDPFDSPKKERPLFCISNRGGMNGEHVGEPLTAPQALMLRFKSILESLFGPGSVGINDPFKGGEITRHMGNLGIIPWLQLEINRKLYLPADKPLTPEPDTSVTETITKLRNKLYDALKQLCETL